MSFISALSLTACDPLPALTLNGANVRQIFRNPQPTTRVNDPANLVYRIDKQLPMRGDPDFEIENLTGDQERWYRRLWEATTGSVQVLDAMTLAASDDAYPYGRGLYTHNHSLLLGLRATGD
ncbi:MAG: hypothetical protein WD273_00715, partial [Trueperaceae bacterium]